jgi:hypothetical protein
MVFLDTERAASQHSGPVEFLDELRTAVAAEKKRVVTPHPLHSHREPRQEDCDVCSAFIVAPIASSLDYQAGTLFGAEMEEFEELCNPFVYAVHRINSPYIRTAESYISQSTNSSGL